MSEEQVLFDREFLSRLRKLFLKLRKRRRLKNQGEQETPSAGFTQEFKDHRSYSPGDDFRSIDWRLYARLGKLFIRIFEKVQEFHIHILLDRSNSMIEPYDRKRVVELRLAAALAYLGLINGHRVSLLSFRRNMNRELPPLKGQGHIHDILEHLKNMDFSGTTDLNASLGGFHPHQDRRGMVFILSDLFGKKPGTSVEAVRHNLSWQEETHIVHILHPEEIDPELSGEVRLMDVETEEVRRMNLSKREIQQYRETFEHYMQELQDQCMKREIDYFPWTTDKQFEDEFLRLLSRGSSLTQR